jgi:hypothetical protein
VIGLAHLPGDDWPPRCVLPYPGSREYHRPASISGKALHVLPMSTPMTTLRPRRSIYKTQVRAVMKRRMNP